MVWEDEVHLLYESSKKLGIAKFYCIFLSVSLIKKSSGLTLYICIYAEGFDMKSRFSFIFVHLIQKTMKIFIWAASIHHSFIYRVNFKGILMLSYNSNANFCSHPRRQKYSSQSIMLKPLLSLDFIFSLHGEKILNYKKPAIKARNIHHSLGSQCLLR